MTHANIDEEFIDELGDTPICEDLLYEVWAVGYDDTNIVINGSELLIDKFDNHSEAVDFADAVTFADVLNLSSEVDFDDKAFDVTYINVEIETVVYDVDNDETINVGTIYRRELTIDNEQEEFIEITSDDYQIDTFGTMKVSGRVLGNRDLGEKVKFLFADEPEKPVLTYEVVFRSVDSVPPYYVCDFAEEFN